MTRSIYVWDGDRPFDDDYSGTYQAEGIYGGIRQFAREHPEAMEINAFAEPDFADLGKLRGLPSEEWSVGYRALVNDSPTITWNRGE